MLPGCLEVLGRDGGRYGWRVCLLRVGGVRAPSRSFERGRVEEAFVYGEEALAYAVGDFVEVARTQLIRYKSVRAWLACLSMGRSEGGRRERYSSSWMIDMIRKLLEQRVSHGWKE